ncbi:hypothetical protein [Bacillus cereus]|uniref:hypothetical protein n=1 Tax=Bacillus cereus TaxID=1396 RepID=UPI000BF99A22|nr:hypothetical protein [Bacillus cereus]PFJ86285.1 hypothetical protein COJ12_19735 [Bacillus cereus]
MRECFDIYLKEELKKGFIKECLLDSNGTDDDQELAQILRQIRSIENYSIQELFENYPIFPNAMNVVISAVFKYYEITSKDGRSKYTAL